MDLVLLAKKIVQKLNRDGLGATLTQAMSARRGYRADTEFDRIHGTDTSGVQSLWKLTITGDNGQYGTRYQATDASTVRRAVDLLNISPAEFTFIDLGTGKGRPLLVAAELGFRTVVGVEFATELAAVARANLAKLHVTRGTVHTMDVADYVFPPGNLVVFLYNPFGPPVLERVLANLGRASGPDVYLVYVRPEHADVLAGCGLLERLNLGDDPLIRFWRKRHPAAA